MEETTTPMKTGLKFGLYLGLAISAFALIAHYAGLQDYSSTDITESLFITVVQWVILFALFFLGIKYYKEHNEGHLTLGDGMVTSLFIGLVSGIISVIFTYVFFTFLAPDVLATVSEAAMEGATADMSNSEMSAEEAEAATETVGNVMNFMMSPIFMAGSTFISRIFSAVIFGLIGSFILKTD